MTKFFVSLAFAVLSLLLGQQAHACYGMDGKPILSFIERIGPALNLAEEDRTNGFYVRFRGDLDQLNELVNEGRARSTNGPGKEPVYRTLARAMKSADRKTAFIIGVGTEGEVSGVWTAKGEPLLEYRAKCLCCGTKYVLTP